MDKLEVITGSVCITWACVGDWEGENAQKNTEKNNWHLEINIAVHVAVCASCGI